MQAIPWKPSPFTLQTTAHIEETLSMSLARVCALHPQAIAIIDKGKAYTFLDLTLRIGGMVQQLLQANPSNEPIALLQSPGIQAVVAWFACGLANKPFLLLDAQHPPERLKFLLQEAACTWVLCDEETNDILASVPGINIIIDKPCKGEFNPHTGLAVNEPAMLFPTSGSSGEPKLIAYANITLQVKVQCSIQLMQVQAGQRVLIAGSHANYGFMHHALVFLLAGGTLCLFDIKQQGFEAIVQAIEEYQVRHIRFTPSLFRRLVAWTGSHSSLKKLAGVRFSGEPLLISDLQLAKSVFNADCLIQNVYGSTESALFIWTCTKDVDLSSLHRVPIGTIYPYSSLAIRHEDGQLNWHEGELIIRSVYHALGDYRHGHIHNERFKFDDEFQHERLYATGDWVELLPNGQLAHLGRLGRMVKVRGNRVYLNEIEHTLLSYPEVDAAAVVVHESNIDVCLYAFVSSENSVLNEVNVMAFLRERLPDYMLPRRIHCLDKLPLLVGGKTNYNALQQMLDLQNESSSLVKDVHDEQRFLIQLWDKYLWKGAHQESGDFIALGGDSLQMMSLVTEAESVLGRKMMATEFQRNSTLKQLMHSFDVVNAHRVELANRPFLQTKEFRKCASEAKGIALAMPNLVGHAQVHLMSKGHFFKEYTLWGAYVNLPSGTLSDNGMCWHVVQQMVEDIRTEKIPAPQVLFGYSISGSMAWMVARCLADTPYCPKWVVMLDAPALHRKASVLQSSLPMQWFEASNQAKPQIIQIRRKPIKTTLYGWVNSNDWLVEDGINFYIDLPTVDHDDINQTELLVHAQEGVSHCMQDNYAHNVMEINTAMPDFLGVLVYACLQGHIHAFSKIVMAYPEPPDGFTLPYLIETTLAVNKCHGSLDALLVVHYALSRYCTSKSLIYLQKRLQRKVHQRQTAYLSTLAPSIFIDLEEQLNTPVVGKATFFVRQLNWVYWIVDVCSALWTANKQKRRNIAMGKP